MSPIEQLELFIFSLYSLDYRKLMQKIFEIPNHRHSFQESLSKNIRSSFNKMLVENFMINNDEGRNSQTLPRHADLVKLEYGVINPCQTVSN